MLCDTSTRLRKLEEFERSMLYWFANTVGFHWSDDITRAYIGYDEEKTEVPNPMAWPGTLDDFKDMMFKRASMPPFQRTTISRMFADRIPKAGQRKGGAVARNETVVSINNVPNAFTSHEFILHFIDFVFDSELLKSCAVQIQEGNEPHLKKIVLSWHNSNNSCEAEMLWWGAFLVKTVDTKQCGSAVLLAYTFQRPLSVHTASNGGRV